MRKAYIDGLQQRVKGLHEQTYCKENNGEIRFANFHKVPHSHRVWLSLLFNLQQLLPFYRRDDAIS